MAADEWRAATQTRTRSMPWGVSVAVDGAHVYVTHVGMRGRDTVFRYDAATLELVAKARFPGHAVESIAHGGVLYVSNSRKDRVMVLDAKDLSVKKHLATGRVPKQIALSPDGKTLYSANWSGGSVSALDIASGRAEHIKTGRHTRGVTVSRDGATIYATVFGAGRIAVIDAATQAVTGRIEACQKPRHVVVTRDDKYVLASCFGGRHVLVIDRKSNRIIRRIRVGRAPKTIALSPDGKFAATANEKSASVSIVNLATWKVETLALEVEQPCGLAVSPDSRRIFVTARGSNQLVVLERDSAGAK